MGGGGGGGVITYEKIPKKTNMIIFLRLFLFLYWKLVGSISFYSRERKLLLKKREKKCNVTTLVYIWGNEDLPLRRTSALRQKPPCFNVRVLITREITGSKDEQK